MLTIRRSQREALAQASMHRFEHALMGHLSAAWPRECRLAGGDVQLLRAVRRIVPAAQRHGYGTSRELTLYALGVLSLGIGFDTDPQCPWARDALGNLGIVEPTARIEAFYAEVVAYLGDVGGPHSLRVVRALARVRQHDFTSGQDPAAEGEERVEELCDRLAAFWPEKFEFQEAAPTARLVREAVNKAARYGIAGALGESVFATLAFFLGHDFDIDPFHPWAADALQHAPAGEPRALALMHAGLARLAASLAPA